MSTKSHRVLGIDPGTRLCGWGVVDVEGPRVRHVDNGVMVLGDSKPLAQRLRQLFDDLDSIMVEFRPQKAAVEGIFQHRNARSALILGHARGVALATLARGGLEVEEYSPQQIKKAVCGHGRAGKLQVQQMVAMRLGLKEVPQEDAADAVAVALCHAQHLAFGQQGDRAGASPISIPKLPRRMRGRAGLAAFAGVSTHQVPELMSHLPPNRALPPNGALPPTPTLPSSKVRVVEPRGRRGPKPPQEDP